jgi:hypothetical protein
MSATRSHDSLESHDRNGDGVATKPSRRLSTETKAAFKTTEFAAYVVVLLGILIAGVVSDSVDGLGATKVWLYATILTSAYMVARGLAKAGSRQPYDEKRS